MKDKLRLVRRNIFSVPLKEANFDFRKFHPGQKAQNRLEFVAKVVLEGYNNAVHDGLTSDLLVKRRMIDGEVVGFYNEGIGMGLYALTLFGAKGTKEGIFWDFVRNEGKNHEYMSYIGAGLAVGVLKRNVLKSFLKKASPTSGQLFINGIGFYYGYFDADKVLRKNFIPRYLEVNDFYTECYYNGVGRAMWFYSGGDPGFIKSEIQHFPAERQAAIWSGVGLACTYANGVSMDVILNLKNEIAKDFKKDLAIGCILANHARDIAGNSNNDEETTMILTGHTKAECNEFAKKSHAALKNQATIDGIPSLKYFYEDIRNFVNP